MRSFFTSLMTMGCVLLFFFSDQVLYAQGARLGVQGILKKSSGAALDDGTYSITFKLYNTEQGGTALWTETQADVEVTSGIYTVALGSVTSLSLPFNEDYFLGVKVGSTPEMSPRAKLTIAPYALSLKGNSNLFPSSGPAGTGTLTPNSSYLLHLYNASGAADERLEGTTGAQLIFKKGSAEPKIGYSSTDNKFRLSSGTSDINIVHTSTNRLSILSGGVSITGSGTYSGGLTSSAGNSKLNNVELSTSSLNNTANTRFQRGGSTKFEISTDGVGVTGLLNVAGSKLYNTSYTFYANDGGTSCENNGTASGSQPYSLSATSKIRATEFNATSDRRIKKDIVPANSLADQEILRRLRVCNYRHIDTVNHNAALKKGFIAQEVQEVFPEAVSSSRGFIPDIYDRPLYYTVRADQLYISMPGEHRLVTGDLVRLMLPEGHRDLHVAAVQDSRSFSLSDWTGIHPEWVFVFGKQVEDFLQVDYDRIHTLNLSVTQELVRQIDSAESDTKSVKRDIEVNKLKMNQLESRMRLMEAKVSN